MKAELYNRGRKILGTLCIAAGVLSLANVETLFQSFRNGEMHETHELVQTQNKWVPKTKITEVESGSFKPLQSALSRSLEQDELREQNPFAHLSTLDPLQDLMRKGVAKFQRDTFRSPNYKEESGYDIVSYEIEHTDGSRSAILAYLEKSEAGSEQVPFVTFMVNNGKTVSHSFYRGGNLIEQSDLTSAEASAFVASRVSTGVPFLSVAR